MWKSLISVHSSERYYKASTICISSALNQNTVIGITISAIITGIVIFILGCLSGYFGKKCKYSIMRSGKTQPLSTTPGVLTSTSNDHQDLEMMENVAYGHVNIH